MKSYSETHGVFRGPQVLVLKMVTELVEAMPDKYLGEDVRCHEVARAVVRHLKWVSGVDGVEVKLYDGKYAYVEHSWLTVKYLETGQVAILDPYAVGRLPQVQLISPSVSHYSLYEVGTRRKDIQRGAAAYLHDAAVDRIAAGI